MLSSFAFHKMESRDCFEGGSGGSLYFPILDSLDFPKSVRNKAEQMIHRMIYDYEREKSCRLDLSEFDLDARVIVSMDNNGSWLDEIEVLISGFMESDEVWLVECQRIHKDDALYKPFKRYFMKQLEKRLFGT